jgi:uncharacterized membrane protein
MTIQQMIRPTQQRLQYAFILVWMLAMIAVPILKWIYGIAIIPIAITAALLVQFSAVMVMMLHAWGIRRTLVTFGLVAVITWSMEFIGTATGFPFGRYSYTDALQPQIGHVPLLIPVAWFMMLVPAWAIAQLIIGRKNRLVYLLISAGAMTAWDLFLDPQMVAWGFWHWEDEGAYFGIPLSNYFGWLLTAFVASVIVRPYRYALPDAPLLMMYAGVWFLQTIGQAVFWGQIGPALVGGLVMGGFLALGIRSYWNHSHDNA